MTGNGGRRIKIVSVQSPGLAVTMVNDLLAEGWRLQYEQVIATSPTDSNTRLILKGLESARVPEYVFYMVRDDNGGQ